MAKTINHKPEEEDMRKRNIYAGIILIAVLCLTVAACSEDEFVKNAYRSLAGAEITYDTTMKLFAAAERDGKLSLENKKEVLKAGNIFREAYVAACNVMENYVSGKEKGSDTAQAIVSASIKEAILQAQRFSGLATSILTPEKNF